MNIDYYHLDRIIILIENMLEKSFNLMYKIRHLSEEERKTREFISHFWSHIQ